MDMSLSKLREIVEYREACWASVHGVAKELGMTTTYFGIVCVKKKKHRVRQLSD